MRLLDLYCCAGGAAVGYRRAGFTEIVGVDINPQPRYPFEFVQGDAIEYVRRYGHLFDAIHASPPCQAFTAARTIRGNDHPDLLGPTRRALLDIGRPYVIENVPGAPLIEPVWLEGTLFGLQTYRRRGFECSFGIEQPVIPPRVAPNAPMGRRVKPGEFILCVGNFSGAEEGRRAMGIDWMTRNELSQAIPPAYTEYIGRQLIRHLAGLRIGCAA